MARSRVHRFTSGNWSVSYNDRTDTATFFYRRRRIGNAAGSSSPAWGDVDYGDAPASVVRQGERAEEAWWDELHAILRVSSAWANAIARQVVL